MIKRICLDDTDRQISRGNDTIEVISLHDIILTPAYNNIYLLDYSPILDKDYNPQLWMLYNQYHLWDFISFVGGGGLYYGEPFIEAKQLLLHILSDKEDDVQIYKCDNDYDCITFLQCYVHGEYDATT